MKFGFLAHAISPEQRNAVRAGSLLADILGSGETGRSWVGMPFLRTLRSPTGSTCTGEVRYLPWTAQDILRRPQAARLMVVDEVNDLAVAGADLVGLGGATSIVGDRGLWTAQRVDVPVTSGNALTSYAAWQGVHDIARLLDLPVADLPLCVVGYPGAIGLAVTRLLLDDGAHVHVVHRPTHVPSALLRYLPERQRDRVSLGSSLDVLAQRPFVVVAASSSGGLIGPATLAPGSVVIDVALPRDVLPGADDRPDVAVLDGGLVSADTLAIDDGPLAPTQGLNGCLAETIVLALEGRAESLSLGRELDPDAVRKIGCAALRHGMRIAPLVRLGRPVLPADIAALRTHHRRPATAPADLTTRTRQRYAAFVNPPLADFYATHAIDRVFTKGFGSTLVTADGTEYLDMVAGYGCLNLGHNNPAVAARLQGFLLTQTPNFVQYVSMPAHTAELAERLCELAPGRMGRAFFSNSGAEAVEAALKLARAATGRSRFVYVHNSFHGKTMGALSVTGRAAHRDRFEPLLPDCIAVPYGDLDALERALAGAAAFIVEPILGEGGVIVPPEGYLAQAQRLCRQAGAVFVVDEIQTGLGRTGTMFASEDIEPDALCLAKSLSGGLVPIGATLASAEVWDAAYGNPHRAALQTSTFGGGNLAAAAGLATLDVLADGSLARHAAAVGARLRTALAEVAATHSVVTEVRGRGLMNAIAFDGDLTGATTALVQEVLARLPGDVGRLVDYLPEDALAALRTAGRAVEATLGDLMCLRVVRELARTHHVLTFVTGNSNRVMRLQPPLVLTEAEADRFVAAFDAVCRTMTVHSTLTTG